MALNGDILYNPVTRDGSLTFRDNGTLVTTYTFDPATYTVHLTERPNDDGFPENEAGVAIDLISMFRDELNRYVPAKAQDYIDEFALEIERESDKVKIKLKGDGGSWLDVVWTGGNVDFAPRPELTLPWPSFSRWVDAQIQGRRLAQGID